MCSLHSYDSWQLLPSNNVQNSDSQKRPEFLELFSVQKFSTRTERTKEMYRRAHHVVQIIIVVGPGVPDVCPREKVQGGFYRLTPRCLRENLRFWRETGV